MARGARHTTIQINPYNRLANQMLQLMFAMTVQRLATVPVEIDGYDIPEWNLRKPASLPLSDSVFMIGRSSTRAATVASAINRFRPKQIELRIAPLNVASLMPAAEYEDVFPLRQDEGKQFGDRHLLIHIRRGDVSAPTHVWYGPLPVNYYRHLIDVTSLEPVFIGELDDSAYCNTLRRAFPQAQFCAGASAKEDFQTLRRAKHIALGVGSFSWVAAYLSKATSIHVPIAGIFDPRECPHADLLPARDGRYIFHAIPKHLWRRRYELSGTEAGDFRLSRGFVRALKTFADLRSSYRRARVRAGIESRCLARLLGQQISPYRGIATIR
jgi:hypothetical protein